MDSYIHAMCLVKYFSAINRNNFQISAENMPGFRPFVINIIGINRLYVYTDYSLG